MWKKIQEHSLEKGPDSARLSQIIEAVSLHRHDKRAEGNRAGSSTQGADRTSALAAIYMVNEAVRLILREGNFDWDTFAHRVGLDDFQVPTSFTSEDKDPPIVSSLESSLEAYRNDFPHRKTLDEAALAYGIMATSITSPGDVAKHLTDANLGNPETVKIKLKRLIDNPITPSVERIVGRFRELEVVTAWQIVSELARNHTDYGASQSVSLPSDEASLAKTGSRPVDDWLQLAQARLHPTYTGTLHGRLLILGVCAVEDIHS